jgi:imidazolonepropionase
MDLVIRKCSQVLTLAGENSQPRTRKGLEDLGIKDNAYVAVDKGAIAEVGIGKPPTADRVIDASGCTVMPGFVDPHTHLVFAGSRENDLLLKLEGKSYMDILNAGGGILSTVRFTREATKEELKELVLGYIDKFVMHGTTTIEAKTGYGLNKEDEIKCLEVINEIDTPVDLVPTFLGAHAVPPEFKERPHEYIEFIISEVLPEVEGLAKFCDIFCEEGVFDIDDSERLLSAAKDFGLWPKIHADEIKNLGASALAADLGAISADHLYVTSEKDMEEMANAEVIGVFMPPTPYSLMQKEYPPARKFIEKGVPVALATDFNPNAWTQSMPFAISLACYNMKMTPPEAVVASTINAAWAIDMQDEVGSLEVGKKADIAIIGAPNFVHIPYRFGTNPVVCTIKKGEVLWTGPEFKGDLN